MQNNSATPHQLHWDDWKMEIAISCRKGSQVVGVVMQLLSV